MFELIIRLLDYVFFGGHYQCSASTERKSFEKTSPQYRNRNNERRENVEKKKKKNNQHIKMTISPCK